MEPGLTSSVLGMSCVQIPLHVQPLRFQALSFRWREYIEAAIALSAPALRVC